MPNYTFNEAYGIFLSEEHFNAIGKVAAVWQLLETGVQMTIWATLGLSNDEGRLLTAAQRFDTHLDVMGALALTVTQTEPEPIDMPALIQRTKQLQGKRNDIVHGLWSPSDNFIAPHSIKLKMKAPVNAPTYSPEDMITVANQVHAAHLDWLKYAVARIEQRQKSAPQTLPQTFPPN